MDREVSNGALYGIVDESTCWNRALDKGGIELGARKVVRRLQNHFVMLLRVASTVLGNADERVPTYKHI